MWKQSHKTTKVISPDEFSELAVCQYALAAWALSRTPLGSED